MFRLDEEHRRIYFSYDERDLAVAFAEMHGYVVVNTYNQGVPSVAAHANLNADAHTRRRFAGCVLPTQKEPGIWTLPIEKRSRVRKVIRLESRPS